MSDTNYIAMLRQHERDCDYQAVSTGDPGKRKAYLANAADWRALREAWEAMAGAATNIERSAIRAGRDEYVISGDDLRTLDAALQKARAT